MEQGEVIAKIDNKIFNEKGFFDYLNNQEKQEVLNRFDNGLSLCVGIFEKGILKLAFVLDFEHTDFIHVREADGDFKNYYRYMNNFAEGVAKGTNRNFLSMNIVRNALKNMAKKLGWEYNQNTEFVRKVYE
jgi:hypothetical protein